MKNRRGPVGQVVFAFPFPLIEAQTLNAPNPFIVIGISYVSAKTAEPLSGRIVEIVKNSQIQENIFRFSLSLPCFRHDYFGMSKRANIRQPQKPAAKRHSVEAKGALDENYSRQTQKSS